MTELNAQHQLQPISAIHGVEKGFFFTGSALYWKADMDHLEYATLAHIETTGNQSESDGRIKDLDFEWGPGGQLEIGYIFNQREGWKASLNGLHLCSRAHGSTHVPSTDFRTHQLSPNWFPPFTGEFTTKASAHWNLNFNTLDLTLGRDFFVSKWISFSPYFGLQGAWIGQTYKAKYDAFFVTGDGLLFRNNHLNFHHDFKGFGFEFGSGFLFHIIDQFGIVGNLEGSLVWGYSSTSQRVNGGFPIEGEGIFNQKIHLHTKNHRLRSSLSSELGFIWEKFWDQNSRRFSLSATYAYSIWFNQGEFQNLFLSSNALNDQAVAYNFPVYERENADLQLQGVSLRAGLEF